LTVRFRINATLPAEHWTFGNFAPGIDADLKVRLENMGTSGKVRCYIDSDSRHDGFPAYELYINGQLLYSWAPCHLYGPLGLFGPSLSNAGVLDQILASIGEDIFFIKPAYHKLEIASSFPEQQLLLADQRMNLNSRLGTTPAMPSRSPGGATSRQPILTTTGSSRRR
jgi:hypothetical protein